MSCPGVPQFKFRRFFVTAIVLCLAVALFAGCSGEKADSGKDSSSQDITAAQFETLQEARIKLDPFIKEIDAIVRTRSALSARLQGVKEVINKYSDIFPEGTGYLPDPNTFAEKETKESLGYELYRMTTKEQPAKYAAQRYLFAVDLMASLAEFEQYVADHTVDNGAKSNPSNPIDDMMGNSAKMYGFGLASKLGGPGYVMVHTHVDPNGAVIYNIGAADRTVPGVPLIQVEAEFVKQAFCDMQEADGIIVTDTKL